MKYVGLFVAQVIDAAHWSARPHDRDIYFADPAHRRGIPLKGLGLLKLSILRFCVVEAKYPVEFPQINCEFQAVAALRWFRICLCGGLKQDRRLLSCVK